MCVWGVGGVGGNKTGSRRGIKNPGPNAFPDPRINIKWSVPSPTLTLKALSTFVGDEIL